MRLVIINHTFEDERFFKRWRILANTHPDLDVYLFAPISYTYGAQRSLTYGFETIKNGHEIEDGNFHIRLIDYIPQKHRSWKSKLLPDALRDIKPDIIYFIGVHTYETIQDIILFRNRELKNSKIIVFSMRGVVLSNRIKKGYNPIKQTLRVGYYLYNEYKLARFNKNIDAVFCHYPDAVSQFRKEGYKGPIYMQTQVGVDCDIFHPSAEDRKLIRNKYGIDDSTYLFGSATRFNYGKGLDEILQALPADGNWKYLMMGSGREDEVKRILEGIDKRGFKDRIILTGFINTWEEMAQHWNALDCAVHFPLTTPEWEETFSLALVQAMATGLPVIGSSSGSVPYQIGPEGIIIDEHDIDALGKQLKYMCDHPAYGVEIGRKMIDRAVRCFDIRHLDDIFYDTLSDIMQNTYDEQKADMTKYKV